MEFYVFSKNIGNFEFINFLSCKVNYGSSFHNYKMETTSHVGEFLFLLLLRLFHYVSCVICKWNVSEKGLKNQRSSCSISCIFKESMKDSLELCSSCYKKELVLFMLLLVFSRFFFFLTSFGKAMINLTRVCLIKKKSQIRHLAVRDTHL